MMIRRRWFKRVTALAVLLVICAVGVVANSQERSAQNRPTGGVARATAPKTRVSLEGGRWHINGRVTNAGSKAEGLLMNVRMVNATFEDANPATRPADFDRDENAARFVAQIPSYAASGVNALTLCLQGGMPGYEGAVNSAFASDGSLRGDYLERVARVIEACDRQGVAVILGCYYQRQSKILKDDQAIRAGIVHVVRWIESVGWKNVVLEIANEYPHGGFAHKLIREPKGTASLVRLAKETSPGLLVTASGLGSGTIDAEVAQACDFLTPHWNSTPVEQIPVRLAALKKYGKPIVVNEDDKTGESAAKALEATVAGGEGYGLMLQKHNQTYPFHFDGPADDPVFYAALMRLTSPAAAQVDSRTLEPMEYFPAADRKEGWRRPASAGEVRRLAGMDVGKLDEALAVAEASTKNGGLLVIRRGWLAYEKYFGLGDHEATPNLASCGKSFTSIAVGILMAERPDLFPGGLDQKVFTPAYLPPGAFPLADARMAEIKLGQLLAFTAGIRGNNPCRADGRDVIIEPPGPDGASAMIDAVALGRREAMSGGRTTSAKSLWCEPGDGYSYSTVSAHLASMIVRHVAGMELEHFVRQRLAEPMGFGPFTYGYKQVRDVTHTPGGGGIAVRATDMLRFGYLLLHDGRWGDRQLVPAEFVRHCRQASPYNPHAPYSLQFDVNTDGHIPEFPHDAFWKSGSGGHTLYIVPSLDLVVWKLGGRDGQYDMRDTGVALDPNLRQKGASRDGWQPTLDDRQAQRQVLAGVIASMTP
jgi:CubicO group peptidase (beta-lactamase class C family)